MNTMTPVAAVIYDFTDGIGSLRISKPKGARRWKLEYLFGNPDLDAVRYVNTVPEWMAFVREECDQTTFRSED